MGDEVRIPIESRIQAEPGPPEADSAPPGRGSSSRVVREASRRTRAAIVVAVVVLVGGGIALVTGGDGPGNEANDTGTNDTDEADRSEAPGVQEVPAGPGGELPSATAGGDPQASTARAAFAEAVLRLDRAGSFAYHGSVHAAAASPFRPGRWTAPDVTVDGEVMLPHLLSHEVAVDPTGAAVETVTSGPIVWSRTASAPDGLEGAAWTVDASTPAPLTRGMAGVAGRIGRAHDPRGEAPDPAGRRVIRATFPGGADEEFGELLSGADILITLDDAGDIVRIVVTSAPVDPQLVLAIDITEVGEPHPIAVPDGGAAGLRATVPVDALEAAGVQPVESGQVPNGWTLVGAWVGPGPRGFRPEECLVLNLTYRDPEAVFDGYLFLGVTAARCGGVGPGIGDERLITAGPFEGTVTESASTTQGTLSDGTTAVNVVTDLPADDLSVVLGRIIPFDPATRPEPLAGIPSS